MPRINNVEARRESAAERRALRAERTDREQIELILARGGNPMCKEILRLEKIDPSLVDITEKGA